LRYGGTLVGVMAIFWPQVTGNGYEAINLINNNPGKYGPSFTARLAYLPEYTGTSSAGLLLSHDQLFVRSAAAAAVLRSTHATLGIYGAYVDWSDSRWRVVAATYYVDVQLDQPARNESFISGYAQAERQFPHGLTVFGRIEDSTRMQGSRYVAFFEDNSGDIDVALRRKVAGLRWDYARRQALSAEYSHTASIQQSAGTVRLQWSAAIP